METAVLPWDLICISEVRSSRDERPLNPLLFLKIEDTMGPTLRALYLYGFTEEGVLSGRSRVAVKNTGNRNYSAGRVRGFLPEKSVSAYRLMIT